MHKQQTCPPTIGVAGGFLVLLAVLLVGKSFVGAWLKAVIQGLHSEN